MFLLPSHSTDTPTRSLSLFALPSLLSVLKRSGSEYEASNNSWTGRAIEYTPLSYAYPSFPASPTVVQSSYLLHEASNIHCSVLSIRMDVYRQIEGKIIASSLHTVQSIPCYCNKRARLYIRVYFIQALQKAEGLIEYCSIDSSM